jgi:heme-degrading monooxygenase HmoA
MIARIWHGYTTPENADVYETLLRTEIFHSIENRNMEGFKDIQLLRRELQNETEFITIMRFNTLEAVKKFAGDEYEKAVVPDKAQQVLKRFDVTSQHYEIKEHLSYP